MEIQQQQILQQVQVITVQTQHQTIVEAIQLIVILIPIPQATQLILTQMVAVVQTAVVQHKQM